MANDLFGKNTRGYENVERNLINLLIVQFFLEWNNSGQWVRSRNLLWSWRYGIKLDSEVTMFSVLFYWSLILSRRWHIFLFSAMHLFTRSWMVWN